MTATPDNTMDCRPRRAATMLERTPEPLLLRLELSSYLLGRTTKRGYKPTSKMGRQQQPTGNRRAVRRVVSRHPRGVPSVRFSPLEELANELHQRREHHRP